MTTISSISVKPRALNLCASKTSEIAARRQAAGLRSRQTPGQNHPITIVRPIGGMIVRTKGGHEGRSVDDRRDPVRGFHSVDHFEAFGFEDRLVAIVQKSVEIALDAEHFVGAPDSQ